jgi:hypothetical protein
MAAEVELLRAAAATAARNGQLGSEMAMRLAPDGGGGAALAVRTGDRQSELELCVDWPPGAGAPRCAIAFHHHGSVLLAESRLAPEMVRECLRDAGHAGVAPLDVLVRSLPPDRAAFVLGDLLARLERRGGCAARVRLCDAQGARTKCQMPEQLGTALAHIMAAGGGADAAALLVALGLS